MISRMAGFYATPKIMVIKLKTWLERKLSDKGMNKSDFARAWGGSYAAYPARGGDKLINHYLCSKSIRFSQIIKAAEILEITVDEFCNALIKSWEEQ